MAGTTTSLTLTRLNGLDLARYLAFVGMVIVNFKVVMSDGSGNALLNQLTGALEGRAAATFVVLAGIGLGLASNKSVDQTVVVTIKRAVFLLVLGLVNTLVFEADIIHYYAFYFFFGVLLFSCSIRILIACIAMLNILFVVLIFGIDYETGWNWKELSYADFWTPIGFVRNLFYNGWHPIIPWLGFLLFGIILSRTSLHKRSTQRILIIVGMLAIAVAEGLSVLISPILDSIHNELGVLAETHPIPPVPLYSLAGIGVASTVVGFCLLIAEWTQKRGLLQLIVPAGRQTLTLYIAHILIGMGVLEAIGLLGGQPITTAFAAALLFCFISTVYASLWARRFKRGPIETLMRILAG